jgi:hypothetical protein
MDENTNGLIYEHPSNATKTTGLRRGTARNPPRTAVSGPRTDCRGDRNCLPVATHMTTQQREKHRGSVVPGKTPRAHARGVVEPPKRIELLTYSLRVNVAAFPYRMDRPLPAE